VVQAAAKLFMPDASWALSYADGYCALLHQNHSAADTAIAVEVTCNKSSTSFQASTCSATTSLLCAAMITSRQFP
jgi:hypothetical protein